MQVQQNTVPAVLHIAPSPTSGDGEGPEDFDFDHLQLIAERLVSNLLEKTDYSKFAPLLSAIYDEADADTILKLAASAKVVIG